jgi:predicted nuclease of predicted toxin-antitoxin system
MKFLLDENLSHSHAERLSQNGFDATSVLGEGLGGASDEHVRAAAIANGRILVTLDGDFGNLMRFSPAGTPGVIWLRLSPPTESAITDALDRTIKALSTIDLTGKLALVDEDKIRIRGA